MLREVRAEIHDPRSLQDQPLLPLLETGVEVMKILVACEYSGRVRSAFRNLGHDAWSCDIQPSEDDSEYHLERDVEEMLQFGWDMMIAFPPCTYLSRAGARWLYPSGQLDERRFAQLQDSRDFFLTLLNAPIPRIAIENPTPFKIAGLPPESQIIQPYQFGDPYTKRTLLWLKGLPQLIPTDIVEPRAPWIASNTGGKVRKQKSHCGAAKDQKDRSRTFHGIADAMARQWSNPVTLERFL
jgi:hypothetical protein